jgi:hypothetical protein
MRGRNRLLDSRTFGQKSFTFKADRQFERALKLLLASGYYSNVPEALFDLVYEKANKLNESVQLPTLAGLSASMAMRQHEVDVKFAELARAIEVRNAMRIMKGGK